jgi:hypothetical protein
MAPYCLYCLVSDIVCLYCLAVAQNCLYCLVTDRVCLYCLASAQYCLCHARVCLYVSTCRSILLVLPCYAQYFCADELLPSTVVLPIYVYCSIWLILFTVLYSTTACYCLYCLDMAQNIHVSTCSNLFVPFRQFFALHTVHSFFLLEL